MIVLGLSLVVYTQEREYLKGLTMGKGMRVQLHPFNTLPILENAYSIAPGFETFMGIKLVSPKKIFVVINGGSVTKGLVPVFRNKPISQ